jgi:DNA-binding MarR family transcriptional regulator
MHYNAFHAWRVIRRLFLKDCMTDPSEKPLGCTCFSLRKLTRTVSRLYDAHLAETGLKTTQYSLLKMIAHEAVPVVTLAARLSIERTTLTRNLKPLIDAGWVTLTPGADSRQRIAAITPDGRNIIKAAKQAWRRAQNELEQTLGLPAVQALHQQVDSALLQLIPLIEERVHAESR